jgi:hypothetical protein
VNPLALAGSLATVLPESTLGTHWFAVLSTFVAVNTVLYVTLSIFKILPKPYLSDVLQNYSRRTETRSIYPSRPAPPERSALRPRRDRPLKAEGPGR